MLIKQGVGFRLSNFIKKSYATVLLLFLGFVCDSQSLYSVDSVEPETMVYYLYVTDFIQSFIEIPTSNVSGDSSTITSKYLAGRAPIYNGTNNKKAGVCSASFLCMQNANGVFTDISNYISVVENGLIVTWFTPTSLINLELDSIVNSMVTECIVKATTKVGIAPLYGQTFNLVVSSDSGKIYFKFSRLGMIF